MSTFAIEKNDQGAPRLKAGQPLSVADFDAIAALTGHKPQRAKKIGIIAARQAVVWTSVDTFWESERTTNVAEPGDWIVTNLRHDRTLLLDSTGRHNQYVIKPSKFAQLYTPVAGENEYGPFYGVKLQTEVECLWFGGGLDVAAPWGERQVMATGYLLRNGSDVYGNEQRSFEATYEIAG